MIPARPIAGFRMSLWSRQCSTMMRGHSAAPPASLVQAPTPPRQDQMGSRSCTSRWIRQRRALAIVRRKRHAQWIGRRLGGRDVAGRRTKSCGRFLPNNRYAVVWTEHSAGTPDIALRLVTPGKTPSGAPRCPHADRGGPQQDADVLWTGKEVVVAWTDSQDVRYRRFSSTLSPLEDEQNLGATAAAEGTRF